ncbi:L-threonylcarbamoyladenylate synthase [Ponticaulis sp.]|uniref:L-threonylcarbamoyladenylate synthase n=1 Tax=Ponticaulis sp. TaxID=2020902 RepID=UPI002629752C|nr:L-threonylcarbamoyladenylate synthase [Ponticaulis sp.]MDF1681582.1 L-threonylcarbamoyladenylate synthase [Ponticaulis sp.]
MTNCTAAIELLYVGELIGLPTETVYGLAADATNADAVAKIFALKNRPQFNPLIAHVSSTDMALAQAEFSGKALQLAAAFWPGPFTMVLPKSASNTICDLARAGLGTQALRFPAHPVAQEVIDAFGKPVAAPSANISGHVSPTSAQHVRDEFGANLPLVLDGGSARIGLESTVVAVLNDEVTLLRPGSVSKDDIEAVVGKIGSSLHDDNAPKSPGMLSRHYSPEARLRLNVTSPESDEAYIGFGPVAATTTLSLSEAGDLTEAASNLYAMIRELDHTYDAIAVAPIPEEGIGAAINDRLRRAAL